MYASVTQVAEKLGISGTRVRTLIKQGRIIGAFKIGKIWVIPLKDGMPQATKAKKGPKLTWDFRARDGVSRIHVNQHVIRANNETGERNPVITVKRHDSNTYCHEAVINGPCRVIYEPEKGLPGCKSAKVWIETFAKVELVCKEFYENLVDKSVFCGVG
jgi:Helix-turn-helix domain